MFLFIPHTFGLCQDALAPGLAAAINALPEMRLRLGDGMLMATIEAVPVEVAPQLPQTPVNFACLSPKLHTFGSADPQVKTITQKSVGHQPQLVPQFVRT